MDAEDRHLGLDRRITRRDFLNGVALDGGGSLASAWLTACGWSLDTAALFAQDRPGYYPPARTGRRGSHDGSWELAHADVIPFYQTRTHGLYGIGIDAVPALDCWGIGLPGFQGLRLEPGPAPQLPIPWNIPFHC